MAFRHSPIQKAWDRFHAAAEKVSVAAQRGTLTYKAHEESFALAREVFDAGLEAEPFDLERFLSAVSAYCDWVATNL